MTSEVPEVTDDILIALLKQVIAESASTNRERVAATAWGPDTLLNDTGFNSYDLVEVIFKIEDRFGIEIDYNANNGINDAKTVGDLRIEIAKLVAKKHVA